MNAVEPPQEDGYDWGLTPYGETPHLVDFGTNNPVAQALDQPDRTLCGQPTDAEPCEPPADAHAVCANCRRRAEGIPHARPVTEVGE